jgi:hypothetical protein
MYLKVINSLTEIQATIKNESTALLSTWAKLIEHWENE